MVSAIVRELESGGEAEISSEAIGEIVMEHLRQLDDVAYVRFASVYRNFREAKDFEAVLGELSGDDDSAARHVTQMIFRILEDQFAQKSEGFESRRPALHGSWRWRSAGAGRAAPGPIPPSARSWSRTASSSAAAGPSPAAGPMPSPRRWRAPARPRAAPRSM